jgi:hypothetical protein
MRKAPGVVAALPMFCCGHTALAGQKTHGAWLFAYFKEPGTQGIYLALSRDGYHYTPLNDGQPWVVPAQAGEVMRDVFLTRGPGGVETGIKFFRRDELPAFPSLDR